MEGLAKKEIVKGMVVVIRYEGPKGGPGEFSFVYSEIYPKFTLFLVFAALTSAR